MPYASHNNAIVIPFGIALSIKIRYRVFLWTPASSAKWPLDNPLSFQTLCRRSEKKVYPLYISHAITFFHCLFYNFLNAAHNNFQNDFWLCIGHCCCGRSRQDRRNLPCHFHHFIPLIRRNEISFFLFDLLRFLRQSWNVIHLHHPLVLFTHPPQKRTVFFHPDKDTNFGMS